jgi:dUTP pyrophosphatase
MIRLKTIDSALEPSYATAASAAADLKSAAAMTIKAGQKGKVPTGVWIESVDWANVPDGMIPELQVRARSGLAFKFGIMLTNGVGTIDADYPDEIQVLLYNTGNQDFAIQRGDRIAQITCNLVPRLAGLPAGGIRLGGFGSTGVGSIV